MTVSEEPTLYDVLEVDPGSSHEELRAAVERARDTYGTESLAVYALVDEDRLGELRAKLEQAAEVLLDPARRASYDRSIGRIGASTLWAEDDDDEVPLPPVEVAPHARRAELQLETAPEDGEEDALAVPRQHALDLALTDTPGPFGKGPQRSEAGTGSLSEATASSAAPLLSGDWAAAVPAEQQGPRAPAEAVPPGVAEAARAVVEPEPVVAEVPVVARGAQEPATGSVSTIPERRGLPPALGLRMKPAEPPGEIPAAEPPPEALPEPGPRHREHRLRLDLPADAEFNGELLRRVRESYGLSLQQVAERTRITRIHLENVEADRYDRLPATVYLRGILVNLARELRLDPARVSKTYLLAAQRSHAGGSLVSGRT